MGFRPCFNRNVYCDLTFKYIEIERYALINFVKELSQSKNHLYAEEYCSASLMLERGGVNIVHSYEVIEVE